MRWTDGRNVFNNLKSCINENICGCLIHSTVYVGCWAYILYGPVKHGSDSLSIDWECIVFKFYNYYYMYTIRTEPEASYDFVYL